MYKLDDLFDFDGDGELDSVERMEMYQFMDNTANRDRNRFFEDDDGLNLFEDSEDEEDEWDEFEDEDEQDPFEDEWDEFEDKDEDEDEDDDEEDDVDLFGEDEVRAELEDAGLDYDELEYMDPDERREMIEDAGLDPDDYDF